MHLTPINRQGKKRRKMQTAPTLSCVYNTFVFQDDNDPDIPKLMNVKIDKKKDAA